jgi:deoxyhypusine synthase
VVDITIASAPILLRLITYIYTGDYDDGSLSGSAVREDVVYRTIDLSEDKDTKQVNKRLIFMPILN